MQQRFDVAEGSRDVRALLAPPLTIAKAELEEGLAAVDEALTRVEEEV